MPLHRYRLTLTTTRPPAAIASTTTHEMHCIDRGEARRAARLADAIATARGHRTTTLYVIDTATGEAIYDARLSRRPP